jgi:hypothetical protein
MTITLRKGRYVARIPGQPVAIAGDWLTAYNAALTLQDTPTPVDARAGYLAGYLAGYIAWQVIDGGKA